MDPNQDDGGMSSTGSSGGGPGIPFSVVRKHVPWALPVSIVTQIAALGLMVLGPLPAVGSLALRMTLLGLGVFSQIASIVVLVRASHLARDRANPPHPMFFGRGPGRRR